MHKQDVRDGLCDHCFDERETLSRAQTQVTERKGKNPGEGGALDRGHNCADVLKE